MTMYMVVRSTLRIYAPFFERDAATEGSPLGGRLFEASLCEIVCFSLVSDAKSAEARRLNITMVYYVYSVREIADLLLPNASSLGMCMLIVSCFFCLFPKPVIVRDTGIRYVLLPPPGRAFENGLKNASIKAALLVAD